MHRRTPRSVAIAMYRGLKVIVTMPAYNAERTLLRAYQEVMAQDYVDEIILVDDASVDGTVQIARQLAGVKVHVHNRNSGYGANQKTCYRLALEDGADIVIMLHPDLQYTPQLIPVMVTMLGTGLYDCVLGSRILNGQALQGGMPLWRYVANRGLTFIQNLFLRSKLSEFHTGYRGFTRKLLLNLPLAENSDDFLFDNQMLLQAIWYRFSIGEVSCPTSYHSGASSISLSSSIRYGFGCLLTLSEFLLAQFGCVHSNRFPRSARRASEPAGTTSEIRTTDVKP